MRRWLVVFLAVSAAVLSFDALRAQARASGAVHHDALAALWAVTIDGMAAAGILGVRSDRRDTRAWAMLLAAFSASVAFQITTPPAWLARAVPPVALFLAFVVLELPRARTVARVPEDFPEPVVPLGPEPEPDRAPTVPPAVPATQTVARPLTPADREALRRVRHDPARLARVAERRGIDPTVAGATVAAWASRNGDHKAGVP